MILVGDSLGMVVQGESSTLPVTMDEMIYHTRIVARTVKHGMVVGDMPFMSYQADLSAAIMNAGRFLKEAGAQAVKLEGGADVSDLIKSISSAGIPVQAHIGLTPQSVHQMGGYKVQREEDRLIEDAEKVQEAGAFSVVLEGIPPEISRKITEKLDIPTIGIGSGKEVDGQVLVINDLLKLGPTMPPSFCKPIANLYDEKKKLIESYLTSNHE